MSCSSSATSADAFRYAAVGCVADCGKLDFGWFR
jgi:hypothetical protein